jgi:hypothetical protein
VSCQLQTLVKQLPDEADEGRMKEVTSDDYCSMRLKLQPAASFSSNSASASATDAVSSSHPPSSSPLPPPSGPQASSSAAAALAQVTPAEPFATAWGQRATSSSSSTATTTSSSSSSSSSGSGGIGAKKKELDVHVTLGFAGTDALLKVPGYRKFTFVGTRGHLDLDLFDASLKQYDAQGTQVAATGGEGNAFSVVGTAGMAAALAASLRHGEATGEWGQLAVGATLWDGLATQYVMDAARASAREGGQWVQVCTYDIAPFSFAE